MDNVLFDLIN